MTPRRRALAWFRRGRSARRRSQSAPGRFGPGSTAVSMWKVAERALEHDDAEVRAVAGRCSRSLSAAPRCVAAA